MPGITVRRRFTVSGAFKSLADAIATGLRKLGFICEALVPNHIDQFIGDALLAKFWHDPAPTPNIPYATKVLYLAEVRVYAEEAVRKPMFSPEPDIEVGGALRFSNGLTATGRSARSAGW